MLSSLHSLTGTGGIVAAVELEVATHTAHFLGKRTESAAYVLQYMTMSEQREKKGYPSATACAASPASSSTHVSCVDDVRELGVTWAEVPQSCTHHKLQDTKLQDQAPRCRSSLQMNNAEKTYQARPHGQQVLYHRPNMTCPLSQRTLKWTKRWTSIPTLLWVEYSLHT